MRGADLRRLHAVAGGRLDVRGTRRRCRRGHPGHAGQPARRGRLRVASPRDGCWRSSAPAQVRIARSVADLDAAHDGDGPPAAVLHLEGAEAIDPGLEALDTWYAAGLRSLGPVWSRPNAFAHGVPFIFPSSPDTGPGLTDAGQALIRQMCRAGNPRRPQPPQRGRLLGCRAGRGRAARRVALRRPRARSRVAQPHRRASSTRSRPATASSGSCSRSSSCATDFADEPDTPVELIARHAAYVAERIGARHVALGSDYDGATIPAPLGDVAGTPRLIAALQDAGFAGDDLAAVAWGNWRRALRRVVALSAALGGHARGAVSAGGGAGSCHPRARAG